MLKESVEREVKLGSDLQLALPDLSSLATRTVRLPEQQLLSTYFDTPDFRLWSRRITLRHRSGEGTGSGVWTLKLPEPSSGATLDRNEVEWEGTLDRLPPAAERIVSGIVRRATLQRVTALQTVRGRWSFRGEEDDRLAELDDDVVTIHGGPRDGGRFRQIEVELGDGDDRFLQGCVDRLLEAGAWIDDDRPKLAHALDLSTGDDDDAPGPASSIGDVVRASIRSGLERILDHEYLLRLGDGPPVAAVHQTRVATRRLRSDLKTFRTLLDPVWVAHTRTDLRWLGDALGRVRDADVLGEHLGLAGGAALGDEEGVPALRQRLGDERRSGTRELSAVLDSDRYLHLLATLQAASERPPFLSPDGVGGPAAGALPGLVKRPVKKLRREVRQAGRHPSDRQLHKLRIRAKQVRYASEAATPVMGKPLRRTAQAAERLQTHLGEHHDAVVAEGWLRERAEGASPPVAFAAGELAGDQGRRQREFRTGWRARVKEIDRRAQAWLP